MSNYKKYLIIAFIALIVIFLFFYLPGYLIFEEKQPCFINKHCQKINCTDLNDNLNKNTPVCYEPMCIDSKCKCEWYGNLLHF